MDLIKVFCMLTIAVSVFEGISAKSAKNSSKGCDKTIRTTRMVRSPKVTSANRGKTIHCVYRLVKYDAGDLVFELNFKSFHVGQPHNATWCANGYLQIVDNSARRNESGYFCGKLQHSRTFLAETDQVLLVFHAVGYNRQAYFRVQTSILPKSLAQERHKELLLDNPGVPVLDTYCDRIFLNCQGFCDVTSPRYPGFYPRNATCRFRVIFNETENSRVVLGGQYYDNFDVWGGPWSTSRCHSNNFCSSKEISTLCPYDYIRIVDITPNGPSVIQTFCGRGHLPRISSRGQEIVIEFVSAVAGSVANDGFHMSVGSESRRELPSGSELTSDGACSFIFDSSDSIQGQFQNLRHWYPPGIRCSYLFVGRPTERVFLHFVTFNANRDEACRSKLTLYDSNGPDGGAVRGVFCGRRQPNETLLSTSERFYVEFDNKLGSYDGSNFEYSVLYTFVDPISSGAHVAGSLCDEIFDSSADGASKKGAFDFFGDRLRLRHRDVSCTFRFVGRHTERIRVTFSRLHFAKTDHHCNGQQRARCTENDYDQAASSFDNLIFLDKERKVVECLCGAVYLPYEIVTLNSYLEIRLHLRNIPRLAYRDVDNYAFRGRFEFLQVGCGESHLGGRQGELQFPSLSRHLLPREVHCRWTLEVGRRMHVLLKFAHLSFTGNCSEEYLRVYSPWSNEPVEQLCRDRQLTEVIPLLRPERQLSAEEDEREEDDTSGATVHRKPSTNKIVLELNSTSTARFRLLWSEVTPAFYFDPGTEARAPNPLCEYRCMGQRLCIPRELVCNGVINCPITNFTWEPLDESLSECASVGTILQWVLLTFSSSFAVVLFIGVSLLWRRKYCRQSE